MTDERCAIAGVFQPASSSAIPLSKRASDGHRRAPEGHHQHIAMRRQRGVERSHRGHAMKNAMVVDQSGVQRWVRVKWPTSLRSAVWMVVVPRSIFSRSISSTST